MSERRPRPLPGRGGSRAAAAASPPVPAPRAERAGRGSPQTAQGGFPPPRHGCAGLPTAAGDYRPRDGGAAAGTAGRASDGPRSDPRHGGAAPLQPSRCRVRGFGLGVSPWLCREPHAHSCYKHGFSAPAPPDPAAETAPAQSCRQRPVRESPHGGQRLERVRTPGDLLFLFLLLLFPLPAEPCSELEAPAAAPGRGAAPPWGRAPPAGLQQPSLPLGPLVLPATAEAPGTQLPGRWVSTKTAYLPAGLFIYILTVLLICGLLKINGRLPPPPVPFI